MSEDEFSKQAGKAFQGVALGVAKLAGGPTGIALTVGATALFNIFEAVANANTQAFQEARIAALEDDVIRVRDEVKALQEARASAGKPAAPPDAPTQVRIFSDFAEAVADAATPEKRTALVHAAARQFDPDAGFPAVRRYWFNAVRSLSDMEVVTLRLLADEVAVYSERNMVHGTGGNPNGNGRALGFTPDSDAAILKTLTLMAQSGTYVRASSWQGGQRYLLTTEGHVLTRFITD
jgi:hypothetical protein